MTEPAPAVEIARDAEWQRLDPRMLLIHPIKELMRFLPVVVGIFIAGSAVRRRCPLALSRHRDPDRARPPAISDDPVPDLGRSRRAPTGPAQHPCTVHQHRPGPHGRPDLVADPSRPGPHDGPDRHRHRVPGHRRTPRPRRAPDASGPSSCGRSCCGGRFRRSPTPPRRRRRDPNPTGSSCASTFAGSPTPRSRCPGS